jgi:hypothetical protein
MTVQAPRNACHTNPAPFADRALDFDPTYPYIDEGTSERKMTDGEIADAVAAKSAAEKVALSVCAGCSALNACRDAVINQDVFGVAGGMTESQRAEARAARKVTLPKPVTLHHAYRNARGDVDTDTVLARLDKGVPASQVAAMMNCSVRTVSRKRKNAERREKAITLALDTPAIDVADIPVGTSTGTIVFIADTTNAVLPQPSPRTIVTADENTIDSLIQGRPVRNPANVTGPLAAVLDLLLDGQVHSRRDCVAAGSTAVPERIALREWAVYHSEPTADENTRMLHPYAAEHTHDERIRRGAARRVTTSIQFVLRTQNYLEKVGNDGYRFTAEGLRSWAAHRRVHALVAV